jgi:hypothetical protein
MMADRLDIAMEQFREFAERLSDDLICCKNRVAKAEAERDAAMAEAARLSILANDILDDVQAWCDAIDQNGTGWDDWDEHYKNFAYRDGLKNYRSRAAIAKTEGGGK